MAILISACSRNNDIHGLSLNDAFSKTATYQGNNNVNHLIRRLLQNDRRAKYSSLGSFFFKQILSLNHQAY